MKFIEFKDVTKTYSNGITACANMNVSIDKGEFVFIIGLTASGKSTFIKMLYREEKPTKGQVIVGGLDVAKLKNKKVYKLRRKLGIVFQDYRLLEKQTVYENVAFALEVIGAPDSQIRPKVLKALEEVGLKHKVHEYPDKLSGGERQRVAIARAIVNNPKLLLCDEPTGNLDPELSKEVMDVLDSINKRLGTTIIMATHDRDIVNRMKKNVVTLKQGHLVSFVEEGKYNDEGI
jgi:cell division transport system ATP-binding protein